MEKYEARIVVLEQRAIALQEKNWNVEDQNHLLKMALAEARRDCQARTIGQSLSDEQE